MQVPSRATKAAHQQASELATTCAKVPDPTTKFEQGHRRSCESENARCASASFQRQKFRADILIVGFTEIAPRGFKYIVQVQLLENLGQGGSAFLACHWEESDSVIQEMFSSVRANSLHP